MITGSKRRIGIDVEVETSTKGFDDIGNKIIKSFNKINTSIKNLQTSMASSFKDLGTNLGKTMADALVSNFNKGMGGLQKSVKSNIPNSLAKQIQTITTAQKIITPSKTTTFSKVRKNRDVKKQIEEMFASQGPSITPMDINAYAEQQSAKIRTAMKSSKRSLDNLALIATTDLGEIKSPRKQIPTTLIKAVRTQLIKNGQGNNLDSAYADVLKSASWDSRLKTKDEYGPMDGGYVKDPAFQTRKLGEWLQREKELTSMKMRVKKELDKTKAFDKDLADSMSRIDNLTGNLSKSHQSGLKENTLFDVKRHTIEKNNIAMERKFYLDYQNAIKLNDALDNKSIQDRMKGVQKRDKDTRSLAKIQTEALKENALIDFERSPAGQMKSKELGLTQLDKLASQSNKSFGEIGVLKLSSITDEKSKLAYLNQESASVFPTMQRNAKHMMGGIADIQIKEAKSAAAKADWMGTFLKEGFKAYPKDIENTLNAALINTRKALSSKTLSTARSGFSLNPIPLISMLGLGAAGAAGVVIPIIPKVMTKVAAGAYNVGKTALTSGFGIAHDDPTVGFDRVKESLKESISDLSSAGFNMASNVAEKFFTVVKVGSGILTVSLGAFAASAYMIKDWGQNILMTTERFKGYNIAMLGTLKTQAHVDEVMAASRRVTQNIPIGQESVMEGTKAMTLISPLRDMLKDSEHLDENMKDLWDVVAGLNAIMPEQGIQGAVYSLREALSGDFMSMKKRFDVPINLWVTADGKSINNVKRDTSKLLKAIALNVRDMVPEETMKLMSSTIGGNLQKIQGYFEQLKSNIGNMGFYGVIVEDLKKVQTQFANFLTSYDSMIFAKRISNSMEAAYTVAKTFVSNMIQLFNYLFGKNIKLDLSSVSNTIADVLETTVKAFQYVTGFFESAAIQDAAKDLFKFMENGIRKAWDVLKDVVPKIVSVLGEIYNNAMTLFNYIRNSTKGFLSDSTLVELAFGAWVLGIDNVVGVVKSLLSFNAPLIALFKVLHQDFGPISLGFKDIASYVGMMFVSMAGFYAMFVVLPNIAAKVMSTFDLFANTSYGQFIDQGKDALGLETSDIYKYEKAQSAFSNFKKLTKDEQWNADAPWNTDAEWSNIGGHARNPNAYKFTTVQQLKKDFFNTDPKSSNMTNDIRSEISQNKPLFNTINDEKFDNFTENFMAAQQRAIDVANQNIKSGTWENHNNALNQPIGQTISETMEHPWDALFDNKTLQDLFGNVMDLGTPNKENYGKIFDKMKGVITDTIKSIRSGIDAGLEDVKGQFGKDKQTEFLKAAFPYALKNSKESGIPVEAILAQAAHESAWGSKTSGDFNYFGIKAQKGYKGSSKTVPTKEEVNGKMIDTVDAFRSYKNMDEGFTDHMNFLNSSRYVSAKNAKTSEEYFSGLQKGGYATDTHYKDQLMKVVESVKKRMPEINSSSNDSSYFEKLWGSGKSAGNAAVVNRPVFTEADIAKNLKEVQDEAMVSIRSTIKELKDMDKKIKGLTFGKSVEETTKEFITTMAGEGTKVGQVALEQNISNIKNTIKGVVNFDYNKLFAPINDQLIDFLIFLPGTGINDIIKTNMRDSSGPLVSSIKRFQPKKLKELQDAGKLAIANAPKEQNVATSYLMRNSYAQVAPDYANLGVYGFTAGQSPEQLLQKKLAESASKVSLDANRGQNNNITMMLSKAVLDFEKEGGPDVLTNLDASVKQLEKDYYSVAKGEDEAAKSLALETWRTGAKVVKGINEQFSNKKGLAGYTFALKTFNDELADIDFRVPSEIARMLAKAPNQQSRADVHAAAAKGINEGQYSGAMSLQEGMQTSVDALATWNTLMLEAGSTLVTGLQSSFETGFFDFMTGKLADLNTMFRTIGRSILSNIGQIISKMMAVSATKMVFGVDVNTGQMSGGGIANSIIGGIFGGGTQMAMAGMDRDQIDEMLYYSGNGASVKDAIAGATTGAGVKTGLLGTLGNAWAGAKAFNAANPAVLPLALATGFLSQPGRLWGGAKDDTQAGLAAYQNASSSRDTMVARRSTDAEKYMMSGRSNTIGNYGFGSPTYSTWSSGDGWFKGPNENHSATNTTAFDESMKSYYDLLKTAAEESYNNTKKLNDLKKNNEIAALEQETTYRKDYLSVIQGMFSSSITSGDYKAQDDLRDKVWDMQTTIDDLITQTTEAYKAMAESVKQIKTDTVSFFTKLIDYKYVKAGTIGKLSNLISGDYSTSNGNPTLRDQTKTSYAQQILDIGKLATDAAQNVVMKYNTNSNDGYLSFKNQFSEFTDLQDYMTRSIIPTATPDQIMGENGYSPYTVDNADLKDLATALTDAMTRKLQYENTILNTADNMSQKTMFGRKDSIKDSYSEISRLQAALGSGMFDPNDFKYGGAQAIADANLKISEYYITIANQLSSWVDSGLLTKGVETLINVTDQAAFEALQIQVNKKTFNNEILSDIKGYSSWKELSPVLAEWKLAGGDIAAYNPGLKSSGMQNSDLGGNIGSSPYAVGYADPFTAYFENMKTQIQTKIQNSTMNGTDYFNAQEELFQLMQEKAEYLKAKSEDSMKALEDMLGAIGDTMKLRIAEEMKTSKGDVIFMDVRSTGDMAKEISAGVKNNDPKVIELIKELKKKLAGF